MQTQESSMWRVVCRLLTIFILAKKIIKMLISALSYIA